MISLILRIIAIVCFALAAAGVNAGRLSILPLGLCLWCLSTVVTM